MLYVVAYNQAYEGADLNYKHNIYVPTGRNIISKCKTMLCSFYCIFF